MLVSYISWANNLKEMDDRVRMEEEVPFITLPQGSLAFQWNGPDTGNILLMIHGFSTPSFVFDRNIDDLINAGYRILRFDHFGRGFSDRPNTLYDQDFYDREILDLLEALEIKDPIDLLGFSLGGGVATTFAARHSERIKKLILVAPIGMSLPRYRLTHFLSLPGLGGWICAFPIRKKLISNFRKAAKKGYVSNQMKLLFERQFNYRGTTDALLSTLRHFPMGQLGEEYDTIGSHSIPTCILWGTNDIVVPYSLHKDVLEHLPGAKFESIEDGGHGIPYTHSAEINEILIDFLSD